MMTDASLPALERRFLPPDGWQWGSFTSPTGRHLRFGYILPSGGTPDGCVVMLPGLSEFAEKYFEVAHDMLARNLGFFVMDWAAQGKSVRPLRDPHKRHTGGFDLDVVDLHTFIEDHVRHKSAAPLIMLAHSMGGNLGLRYLEAYPGIFSCAAFSAPMLGILALKKIGPRLRAGLIALLNLLASRQYVFGGGPWTARPETHQKLLTHDPVRGTVQDAWSLHDPALRVGGITFGWLYEASRSCARMSPPSNLLPPTLFAIAGQEHLVDNEAVRAFAAHSPRAKLVEFPDSRHEILMERDSIRNLFFRAFDEFLLINRVSNK